MPKVTHFEIHADDPKRAIKFYTNVFDWKAQKWDGPMDYWMLTTGLDKEPGINGAIMKRETPNKCDDAITTFVCWITVPSVDKYSTKITKNGGKIETQKMEVPGMGWTARFKDTEGNIFGIIEMTQTAK